MTRFFVDSSDLNKETFSLRGENAAHAKVLRLKVSEEIIACDGAGNAKRCVINQADGGNYLVKPLEQVQNTSEPKIRASIYMAFPKADKLEHVIQKATELGAFEIVAFPSARCVSKPDEKSLKKKQERWQKIASSAAEQSGRDRIPEIIVLSSFQQALQRAMAADKAVLFYENEQAVTLRMALEEGSFSSISLLTGPEGGLEESEVQKARESGFSVCTLGSRILRCETAPLCALSAVMYATGEF